MSGNIQEVDETNFNTVVLQSNKPVLVDCWAPWCMPCRVQQPILEKVADEFQGKALIVSLNTEEHPDAAYGLNIHSIPTLVILTMGSRLYPSARTIPPGCRPATRSCSRIPMPCSPNCPTTPARGARGRRSSWAPTGRGAGPGIPADERATPVRHRSTAAPR